MKKTIIVIPLNSVNKNGRSYIKPSLNADFKIPILSSIPNKFERDDFETIGFCENLKIKNNFLVADISLNQNDIEKLLEESELKLSVSNVGFINKSNIIENYEK